MSLFNDLFINLCILVMLLFTFNLITRRRKGFISQCRSVPRKLHLGVNMGVLGIVLMYYTIHVNGTIVDLRQLPVVLAALYGGVVPSLIAAVIIAIGRIGLFGYSNATTMAVSLIILIGVSCGVWSKVKTSLINKMLLMSVADLVLTSMVFAQVIQNRAALLHIYVAYWLVTIAGGFLVLYLMEYLRKTKEQFEKASENAETDYLTGLYNVRGFNKLLEESLMKADQHREQISVILLDIDHFKKINDTYGHQSGDEVLKQLSVLLRDSSRSIDIVSRNGGEEFSVILPSCNRAQAVEVAERIRTAVEACLFRLANELPVNLTVSLGVSTYGDTVYQHEEILKQADRCLYEAKANGRNKVIQEC